MTNKEIQEILKQLNLYEGDIDGIIGIKSIQATKEFQKLNKLTEDGKTDKKTLVRLKQATFPKQKDVHTFYGEVGTNQAKLILPYKMYLAWDKKKTIQSFSCHKKVLKPMSNIFKDTLAHYGIDEIKRLKLDLFGGCLNVRKMRGGTQYSMHSYGIAVDLDPINNKLKWNADKASFAKKEYDAFWDIVEKNGAVSLGRERNYDFMHFQFARLDK